VSCAIRLHSRESPSRDKPDELGPPAAVFADIMEDLQHFRVAEEPSRFEVKPLYGPSNPGGPRPQHTLLNTRHRFVALPGFFWCKESPGFPAALDWEGRDARDAIWTQHLRVQIARDDDTKTDVNDWLLWPADYERGSGPARNRLGYRGIMASPPVRLAPQPHGTRDDLEALRDYFAYLFALRRQAVFASNVCDRSYNVWLPPALLVPVAGRRGHPRPNATLAMLSFVTLLRLPHQSSWRPTVTVTTLFVPVTSTAVTGQHGEDLVRLKPRGLCDEREARAITASLEGSTSQALKVGQNRYTCRGGLVGYLTAIARSRCPDRYDLPHTVKRCRCFPPKIPAGAGGIAAAWPIRKYLEAVMLVVASRAPQTKWEPRREGRKTDPWLQSWRRHIRQASRQRMAASEVARSVRLTSVWSVQLLSRRQIAWAEREDRYLPARTLGQRLSRPRPAGRPGGVDSQFAGLPKDVRGVARQFAGIGHLPTWRDRVDTVSTVDNQGGMTWSMPRYRCLLSVQSVRDDHFPATSPLNSFVRMGTMVMAAAAIREMTQALLHETVQASTSAALAHVDKNLLVELEEVYGSDIVGPAFSRFYRSLREHLDLDEEYRLVRERVHSLSAAISQETNIKANKRAGGVAFAAAAFGAAVLLMALYSYPRPSRPGISYKWAAYGVPGMAFAFALVAIFVAFGPMRVRGKLLAVIGVLTATLAVLFFLWAAFHFDQQFNPP
jgi:hypothetical protein